MKEYFSPQRLEPLKVESSPCWPTLHCTDVEEALTVYNNRGRPAHGQWYGTQTTLLPFANPEKIATQVVEILTKWLKERGLVFIG